MGQERSKRQVLSLSLSDRSEPCILCRCGLNGANVAETLASHCWRKVCIIGREAHLACTIPEGDYADMDGVDIESIQYADNRKPQARRGKLFK